MERDHEKNNCNFDGIDTCIITKYDLSEREKNIKKNFFKRKDEEKNSKKIEEEKKYYPQFLYNEENVEKFVKDNFNKNGSQEILNRRNDQMNNINSNTGKSLLLFLIFLMNL
jgi:hypothetical protein